MKHVLKVLRELRVSGGIYFFYLPILPPKSPHEIKFDLIYFVSFFVFTIFLKMFKSDLEWWSSDDVSSMASVKHPLTSPLKLSNCCQLYFSMKRKQWEKTGHFYFFSLNIQFHSEMYNKT